MTDQLCNMAISFTSRDYEPRATPPRSSLSIDLCVTCH